MIRIHQIEISSLPSVQQTTLINMIMSVATMKLNAASTSLMSKLSQLHDGKDWFVYRGGHHLALGKKGAEHAPLVKLIDISDAGLYMNTTDFDPLVCDERKAMGLCVFD